MVATHLNDLVFDAKSSSYRLASVIDCLDVNGVVVLRNLFDPNYLDPFINKAEEYIRKPAIAGSFGYYKKDYPKRIVDPFTIENFPRLCLAEKLIDIIESYMESTCTLSEAFIKFDRATSYNYFPLHTDFWPGIKKVTDQAVTITETELQQKLAVGGALYLRDTTEGAFRYCLGTHKLMAPKGSRLSKYTAAEQAEINKYNWRIEGRRGDLILFDDRGFHGPDQPSKHDRLVVLLDWFNDRVWGGATQNTPFRVFTSDLTHLTQNQLRVLGVGAKQQKPREQYHMHGFATSRKGLYNIASKFVNLAGLSTHIKKTIKQKIKL